MLAAARAVPELRVEPSNLGPQHIASVWSGIVCLSENLLVGT